jgi:hypothetical protein
MFRALTLALLLGTTACFAPKLRVDLNYALTELDGQVSAVDTSGGPATTTYASTSDLGLGDSEGSLQPRVRLEWGGFELMVDHQSYSYSGDGTATVDLEFAGTTISAGDDVASSLDMTISTAMIFVDVLPTDMVRLGLGLGVSYADEQIEFESLTLAPGARAGSDEAAPIPVIGVHAGLAFDQIELDVLARGLSVDISDVKATFLDVDGALVWSFLGKGHVSGNLRLGYRHVALDAEFDDGSSAVVLDLTSSGPYLGLGVVF